MQWQPSSCGWGVVQLLILMKPEESYSARDTLHRLEEELINLEEHPSDIIDSLCHRLPHPRVRNL